MTVNMSQITNKCVCVCVRLQELKSDGSAACGTSGSGTPQVVSSSIRVLAQALTTIEQGIERRFLKAPLGECVRPEVCVCVCVRVLKYLCSCR